MTTPLDPTVPEAGKNGWDIYLALVPALAYFVIISLLPLAPETWPGESHAWLAFLNTLFLVLTPLIASGYAARAYMGTGSVVVLTMGSGLLLLAVSSLISSHAIRTQDGPNCAVTVFNTGMLLCSLLNLAAASMSFTNGGRWKRLPGGRALHVLLFYGGSFLIIGFVTLLGVVQLLPAFFVPDEGPTPVRQVVLSSAVLLFTVSFAMFMNMHFRYRIRFLYWYALSLLLIAQGLGIILFLHRMGGLTNWVGRAYEYLGGIYFLVAVVMAFRGARTRGVSIEEALPALVEAEALKNAEEALRVQAQIVKQIHDAVISTDLQGHITSWNPGAERMLGYGAGEAVGKHASFVLPEDQQDFLESGVIDPLREKGSHETEVALRRGSGEVLVAHLSLSLLKDARGEPQGTICHAVDITTRKRAERDLAQSEEKFRSIFQMNPVAMIVSLLEESRILDVNRAFEEMMGYPREEVIGRRALDIGIWLEAGERERFVSGLREQGSLRNVEVQLKTKGGEIKDLVGSAELVTMEGVQCMMSGWVDITQAKRMQQELRKSRDELETRVKERTAELAQRAEQLARLSSELTLAEKRERRRLAGIIHDNLQQQIVGAKMRLEVLTGDVPHDQKKSLEEVQALLMDALKTSRSLNAQLAPHVLYDHGLAPALEWLAQSMRESYQLEVETDLAPDVNVPSEDLKVLLFESVRELLFNVVKHAGATAARIDMWRRDAGRLSITVRDRGVGFDPEQLKRDLAESEGFGLFSISERLDLIGGRMEMESAPGQGAAFHLIAPTGPEAAPEEPVEKTAVTPEEAPAGPAPARPTIRVLVVDDHVVMRQGISSMISRHPDIEVVGEAADGSTAVQMARELQPEVILMDINMPLMDGVEATRIIHSERPATRIIGLSMYDDPETRKGMLNAGAAEFVAKSGHTDLLLKAIRNGEARRAE
jgi:PAS domain S-box-containing protein